MLKDIWFDMRSVLRGTKKLKEIDWVTYVVFLSCVLMYLLTVLLQSIYHSDVNSKIALGAYYRPFVIITHDYWRFLTACFLHGDFLHLLCNMIALINCGPMIERMYGHKWFAIILFGSVIMGSGFAHLAGTEMMVGLSGGLYGVMGAMVVLAWYHNWFSIPNVRDSFIRTALINIFISFLPGISLMAHLGGFVFGLFAGMYSLQTIYKKKSSTAINAGIALVVLSLVLCVQIIRKPYLDKIYIRTDIEVLEIYDDFHLPVERKAKRLERYYINFKK